MNIPMLCNLYGKIDDQSKSVLVIEKNLEVSPEKNCWIFWIYLFEQLCDP